MSFKEKTKGKIYIQKIFLWCSVPAELKAGVQAGKREPLEGLVGSWPLGRYWF